MRGSDSASSACGGRVISFFSPLLPSLHLLEGRDRRVSRVGIVRIGIGIAIRDRVRVSRVGIVGIGIGR